MARLKRTPRADEISLLKRCSVKNGGRVGIFLYLTKYENHKAVLKGTFLRWDTEDGWRRFAEGLEKTEPAKPLNLRMLGIDLDYTVNRGDKFLLALDGVKLVRKTISKPLSKEEFLETNLMSKYNNRYETSFGGLDFLDIGSGKWVFEEKKPLERDYGKKIIY